MKYRHSIIFAKQAWVGWLVLFAMSACSSNAQGIDTLVEEAPANSYSFNVIYLNFPASGEINKSQPLNLKFFTSEGVMNLSVHEGGMSRYFSHQGASMLSFYRKDGTDAEGEIIYKAILNVDLGKSGQKLVFVIRNPIGKLMARTFEMNLEAFPLNSMQLLNFSERPVQARIAKAVGAVAPFKAKNFSVELKKRKEALDFALATEVDGKPQVIEITRLAFTKNGRRLILVHDDTLKTDKVCYKVFPIARAIAIQNQSDKELEVEDYEKYRREERMAQSPGQ